MEDVLRRAQGLVESFDELVRAELPPDAELFDAHVHLGLDIDGMRGDLDELLRIQRAHGISRSFVFCLDEPDRHPGFRAPNDRTLAFAVQSGGELIPFVRLDLTESPIEEALRCLDRGAGGIKLHPRAQKFMLDDERLAPVFELAADRKVPILIHGGRGLPPIADALARLMDAYEPQLIIAHAGIADLAALARHFSCRPGVFFDTSVWSPLDLLDLYRLVSPEQVLYASDYPYGTQPASLLASLRTARMAARYVGKLPFATVRDGGHQVLESIRKYAAYPRQLVNVLVCSMAVQGLRIVQAYALGRGLGIDAPLTIYFAFIPLILLVMLLPVTFNGIGTSQAAFVWFFAQAGVDAATAFALSVLFVALGIIGNLPGGILYALGHLRPGPDRARS